LTIYMDQRHWNDASKAERRKGKFTPEEIHKLQRLLCKYAYRHNLTKQQLAELCSDTTPPEHRKAWLKIAKFFPERSVQSVHNACKRMFNPHNYKGRWNLWEEQELIRYVQANGTKWKEFAELIGRTALNVKDKWKQMGGSNYNARKRGPWSGEEVLQLVLLIQENAKKQYVDEAFMKTYLNDELTLRKQLESALSSHREELLNLEINWTIIADRLVTRSAVDCRLKWTNELYARLTNADIFTDVEDMQLIGFIKKQDAVDDNEIDFSLIDNGRPSAINRSRWKILKKGVAGRLDMDIADVLEKLEYQYTVVQAEPETILDYYQRNYLEGKQDLRAEETKIS